jgi:hypothetical protein
MFRPTSLVLYVVSMATILTISSKPRTTSKGRKPRILRDPPPHKALLRFHKIIYNLKHQLFYITQFLIRESSILNKRLLLPHNRWVSTLTQFKYNLGILHIIVFSSPLKRRSSYKHHVVNMVCLPTLIQPHRKHPDYQQGNL